MIILFFGQPASGKTTLADAYIDKMDETYGVQSTLNFIRLDGDKWREITKNKDYSKQGRVNNLKGAFHTAIYLEQMGFTPVLSFVTPYQELRQYLSDNSSKLVQIYLTYNQDRGRSMNFATDFEAPSDDEKMLRLDTTLEPIDKCLTKVIEYVESMD